MIKKKLSTNKYDNMTNEKQKVIKEDTKIISR